MGALVQEPHFRWGQFGRSICLSATLASFATFACAIERTDELVCGFEDGSEAVLKATHDWSPLGAVAGLIGDVSSRKHQGSYFAHFRLENGRESKAPAGAMFGIPLDRGALVQSIGVRLCADVARWKGRPLVNGAFLTDDGNWLNVGSTSPVLSSYPVAMPKWVSKYLLQIGGSPAKAANFVAPVGNILVSEQPIGDAKENYIIRSVYQSLSRDGGKTWAPPVLTPHAYIFEIGRVIEEQSFVGRPLSYEGRKFQPAQFTKPQSPQEKDAEIRKLPVQWQKVITEAGDVGG